MDSPPDPSDPSKFLLKCTKVVVWARDVANSEAATETQHSIAAHGPMTEWRTALTHVLWIVKWHNTRGLIPVKPAVILKNELALELDKAIELKCLILSVSVTSGIRGRQARTFDMGLQLQQGTSVGPNQTVFAAPK